MAITRDELEAAVREHMVAEAVRDLDRLRGTLDEDVEYVIRTPAYPDDPTPYGHFTGADTYIAMWEHLYELFETYEIELLDVAADPERGEAFCRLQITATPKEEWYGLPAGKPIRWWPAAVCAFDDSGTMLSETVFGSFPPILAGFDRMKAYVVETGD